MPTLYIKVGETVINSRLLARVKICAKHKFWGFEIAYFSYTNRCTSYTNININYYEL